VQSAVHIAIMNPLGVYSERGQFPLRAEAGRLDDDQLAGVPDSGAAAYLIWSGPFASLAGALPAPARRACTARPRSPGHQENRHTPMRQGLGRGDPGPGDGTGPAEAPASPVKPRSTRNRLRNATENGTELRYDYKDYIGSRPMQGVHRPF
jgi:hypothetical protein